MVGDTLRDIEAGKRASMATALVTGGDAATTADDERAATLADLCVHSLAELVERFLSPTAN